MVVPVGYTDGVPPSALDITHAAPTIPATTSHATEGTFGASPKDALGMTKARRHQLRLGGGIGDSATAQRTPGDVRVPE